MAVVPVEDTSLVEAMSVLWPRATVTRDQGHRSPGARDFLVLPGGRQTAVPVTPHAVSARVVEQASAAAGPRARMLRLGLAGALRLGLGTVARDRITVTGPEEDSLAEFLTAVLGDEVRLAVSTGTARVNRKPVIEVFGSDGRPRCFVKLGRSTLAWDDIRAEAQALATVADLTERGLRVPTALWYGAWLGMPVLLMTALPQDRWQRRRDRRRPPVREMRILTDLFRETSARPATMDWWDSVRRRLGSVADDRTRASALACWGSLAHRADRPVPVSAWHGDWAPWNMARFRGRLGLWDWERFATGVPAGLDALHWAVNVSPMRAPEQVLTALCRAEPAWRAVVGEDPAAGLMPGLYLAEMAARYLPLADGSEGDLIADRARLFLTAWQEWSLRG